MSEREADALRTANLEFYRAFANRDFAAMESVWAREAEVLCLHPGWPLLSGRSAVLESWRQILANPGAPRIVCRKVQALVFAEIGIVTCEEEVEGGLLAATNIFVREQGRWRMVHHHASVIVDPPAEPVQRERLH
ncbi:MAG TPA: nuclear transport factor 2 family protein [Stellaceae bacterium]|nr:nuclear transport factor 2 family protein [Stellaceae bacterium]